jgi:4-hydroxy-tetrahydrodipicolinate synthase
LGYQGILLIAPWYQVHTQRELYAHYKAVRDAISIPIMAYNNPPVTGVQLTVELLERMANDGIIQYLKDADSDPYALARLKMRVGDALQLFYGHDNNALGAFAFGATGWVSGTANFGPEKWSRFVHTCIDDGDFVAARAQWYEILPFIELATVGQQGARPDWIAVIKEGLQLRGRRVGSVRPPMLPLPEHIAARLREVVGQLYAAQASPPA